MASSTDLGERLEQYVSSLLQAGRYRSRSEVLTEGVRLIEERENRLAELDTALSRGLADADAGRVTPAAIVEQRLADKYAAKEK